MRREWIAALAVVVVLVAAAGLFALRSWVGIEEGEQLSASGESSAPASEALPTPATPAPDPSPTDTPSTSPTTSPTPTPTLSSVSTESIVEEIRSTLDQQGRATVVRCPSPVPAGAGTTFRCTVAYASEPARRAARATVRITGPGPQFVWRSAPD